MRLFLLIGILCSLSGAAIASGKPAEEPLKSGPESGDMVPSFYTRAVTGPLRNKSVCYVCRNGARPVVMLLMRRIGPELKPLLKGIDTIVDENRANGLRGFGVLIEDDARKATSAVQTFAFNNKIRFPLTVSGEGIANGHKLHKKAALTVVLYRKQKVVKTWTFREGELNKADVAAISKHVKDFASKK